MNDTEWLASQFEDNRAHLTAVAHRMLGSASEADDAVQESWLRLSRADTSGIENLTGWLTTVVARVSLDMLRSRKSRREDPLDVAVPDTAESIERGANPEDELMLADSVGLAMLVVLESLAPAERVAFVLHDLFAVPFDDISEIVGRSPAATRQLASRARRLVQQGDPKQVDVTRQREVVDAFLAASRGGDFEALLGLLDPDVVVRADLVAVQFGAEGEVRGADAVARTFAGRAKAAQPALIDGAFGLAWAPGGEPRVVFDLTISEGVIVAIEMLADPETLGSLELTLYEG